MLLSIVAAALRARRAAARCCCSSWTVSPRSTTCVATTSATPCSSRWPGGCGPASRETDLPARLSGDEFAVVTEASPVQAYALATRLLTMLAEPIVLPGVTVHLTASVGMTDLAGGARGDDVLRRADLALRRAKQLGRGRVEWYDEAVEQAHAAPDDAGAGAARRARAAASWTCIYQPILDLVAEPPARRSRHCCGGATRGWARCCRSTSFPVAEDLGLIDEIGSWVLRPGLPAARRSGCAEGRDLSMAVNVSPRQLDGPG